MSASMSVQKGSPFTDASGLKTYDLKAAPKHEFRRYDGCGDPTCGGPLKPGEFVESHRYGGQGIVIAINDEQITILWSVMPRNPLSGFSLPSPRRVFTPTFAQQLIRVQPMTMPAASVFYLEYSYPNVMLDKQCTEGPLWKRLSWRVYRTMKKLLTRIQGKINSLRRKLNPPAPKQGLPKKSDECLEAVSTLVKKYDLRTK